MRESNATELARGRAAATTVRQRCWALELCGSGAGPVQVSMAPWSQRRSHIDSLPSPSCAGAHTLGLQGLYADSPPFPHAPPPSLRPPHTNSRSPREEPLLARVALGRTPPIGCARPPACATRPPSTRCLPRCSMPGWGGTPGAEPALPSHQRAPTDPTSKRGRPPLPTACVWRARPPAPLASTAQATCSRRAARA